MRCLQLARQQLEEKEIEIAELKTLCEQQKVCFQTFYVYIMNEQQILNCLHASVYSAVCQPCWQSRYRFSSVLFFSFFFLYLPIKQIHNCFVAYYIMARSSTAKLYYLLYHWNVWGSYTSTCRWHTDKILLLFIKW